MDDDKFAEQLVEPRRHFAAVLLGSITEIDACLPTLTGEGCDVPGAVCTAHRKVSDLRGNGPVLGFIATGQAARVCQGILQQASHDKRGLTKQEMANLKNGLAALRAAAQNDLQPGPPASAAVARASDRSGSSDRPASATPGIPGLRDATALPPLSE